MPYYNFTEAFVCCKICSNYYYCDPYKSLVSGLRELKQRIFVTPPSSHVEIIREYMPVLVQILSIIKNIESEEHCLSGMQEIIKQVKGWLNVLKTEHQRRPNFSQLSHLLSTPNYSQADIAYNTAYGTGNVEDIDVEHIIQNAKCEPITKSLSDVTGLTEVKKIIRTALILPKIHPQLFTGNRRPWNKILLYGPPGTGKTCLAHAIAGEVKGELYSISSADLFSRWYGESEKIIRSLFEYFQKTDTQNVLFIDEVDSICRIRTSGEEDLMRRIKTQLLIGLDKLQSGSLNVKTFFICATNCPWEIDSAFLRRFQKRVYIPLPDISARETIMRKLCAEVAISISEDEWKTIAKITEGYSGADLETLTREALFQPLQELDNCNTWVCSEKNAGLMLPCSPKTVGAIQCRLEHICPEQITMRDVNFNDFHVAIRNTKKTVTEGEIQKYNSFTENFGQTG